MKYYLLILTLLSSTLVWAQDPSEVEMADQFRAEGKIYVVLAVVLLVLVGLFIYLIRIDRKIAKLEKDKKSEE